MPHDTQPLQVAGGEEEGGEGAQQEGRLGL